MVRRKPDRREIAAAYPRQAFDEDARRNALPAAAVLYGVRLTLDGKGGLTLRRAAQHTGEAAAAGTAPFLCPFFVETASALTDSGEHGGMEVKRDRVADHRGEYERFIDKLLEAVAQLDPTPAPGAHDARLQGLRQ